MTSDGQRFRRRTLRRGYKVDEVDTFLDRVELTLAGGPVDTPVTAQEVHDVEFAVRFGGYDEWQVDLHLDRVERQLVELGDPGAGLGRRSDGPATGIQAPVSPLPHRPSPSPASATRFGQPEPPPPPRYEQPAFAGPYDRTETFHQDMTTEMHVGDLRPPEWARPPAGAAPAAGGPPVGGRPVGNPPVGGPPVGGPGGPLRGRPPSGPPPGGPMAPPHLGGPGAAGPPGGMAPPGMGGVPAGDIQRVDELRRGFQPRRFGSGYDRGQVDHLFEQILAGMSGRGSLSVSEGELDPRRFNLVAGGYFEADVDNALRELRDILRRL